MGENSDFVSSFAPAQITPGERWKKFNKLDPFMVHLNLKHTTSQQQQEVEDKVTLLVTPKPEECTSITNQMKRDSYRKKRKKLCNFRKRNFIVEKEENEDFYSLLPDLGGENFEESFNYGEYDCKVKDESFDDFQEDETPYDDDLDELDIGDNSKFEAKMEEFEDEEYIPPGEDNNEEDNHEDDDFNGERSDLLLTALTLDQFVVRDSARLPRGPRAIREDTSDDDDDEGDENDKVIKRRKKVKITGENSLADRKLYGCMFCSFTNRKQSWLQHLKKSHFDQGLIFCEESKTCGMPFQDPELLLRHKEQVHPDKRNQCSMCPKHFKFPSMLKAHMETHSGNKEKKIVVCTYCGKEFTSRAGLKAHEAKYHTNNLQYKCDYEGCSKEFFSKSQLTVHIRMHTGEMPFVCSFCAAAFPSNQRLLQHERTVHGPKDPNNGGGGGGPPKEIVYTTCHICNKQVRKKTITVHLRTHDPDAKSFCSFCGKGFSSDASKLRHEKIHKSEKNFSCKFCGKSFVQKVNMEAHERVHTGEKPYACKKCGESFTQGTRRNIHERSCDGNQSSRAQKPANELQQQQVYS